MSFFSWPAKPPRGIDALYYRATGKTPIAIWQGWRKVNWGLIGALLFSMAVWTAAFLLVFHAIRGAE